MSREMPSRILGGGIKILNVSIKKDFGGFYLDISFKNNGNRMGILGASGCGKSMTLKCIAGIETPDQGRIVLNGRVLFDSKKKINVAPQKRNVGYMFQSYALFPTMTIEENISTGVKGSKDEKKTVVQAQIEKFQLQGLEKRYPRQLSGGQQQRVALARIMAYNPEIIMLDEPFSALDACLKDKLQQDLFETLTHYSGDVVMVSHNRDEIFKFCDTLSVMDQGRVAAEGGTRELFKKPLNVVSARLTGCKNISKIEKINDYELQAIDWGIRLKTVEAIKEETTYVGIRAHRLLPVNDPQTDNTMKIDLVSFTETAFEAAYLVKNALKPDTQNIWWLTAKKEFDFVVLDGVAEYLMFPPEELMLLQA